jgi:hypothetical protein
LEPLIREMNSAKIGAILDYVAEADLDETQTEFVAAGSDAEVPTNTIAELTLVDALAQPHVMNEAMMDRRQDAMAVTHIYKDDDQCDENMEISKTAIRHAAMQVCILPLSSACTVYCRWTVCTHNHATETCTLTVIPAIRTLDSLKQVSHRLLQQR